MCVVLCRVFITALSGARQSRTARPPPPSVTQREPRPTLTHAATTTTGHWLALGIYTLDIYTLDIYTLDIYTRDIYTLDIYTLGIYTLDI